MMDFLLKHSKAILITSTVLVIVSVISVIAFGFNLGIDFTSGSLWQVRMTGVETSDLRNFFAEEFGIEELNIAIDQSENIYALTLREITEHERQEILTAMKERFGEVEDLDFSTISPSISSELKGKAYTAIALVMVGISLFIAFAFRKVSEPIKSWKYGVITLITLIHDVVIPAGVFVYLGKFAEVGIDINFIVAMLFVMGFSVHDTIVVFDRIRENLLIVKEEKKRQPLQEIVNRSIKETVARSINTSLTLVLIVITLFFFGPISTKMFVFAILIGTIAGTYSSIFFASPLLVFAERFSRNPHGQFKS